MAGGLSVPSNDRTLLLSRARRLFGGFVALALGVSVLEWLDAGTPVWPQRAVAALALLGVGAWALHVVRRERSGPVGDLLVVASLVALGWGLGRAGAIMVAMLAALQLRALFGTRASVAVATGAITGAFVIVDALRRGVLGAMSLGTLTVVSAAIAVVIVLRALAEILAQRDLEATWSEVLADAGARLVGATTPGEVAAIRATAHEGIEQLAREGIAVPGQPAVLQERLDGQVSLAYERIDSDTRYRTLAEHSRDGIYLLQLEPEVRYRYLNPAGATLLGVRIEDFVADPHIDRLLLHADDRTALVERRRTHGVLEGPVEVRVRGEGGTRWIAIEERLLEGQDGSRSALGTLRDVTERRRQEAALRSALDHERRAVEELREVDEMKSTFLRAVSHELRTPLAAVVGAAETLSTRHEVLTAEQIGVLAEVAERRARHLERLLEDLLDVDRLTRGSVEPQRAPTQVLALVQRVVAEHDAATHPTVVDGEEVTVGLDAANVERIVDNLLRNAHKHTPVGTRIRCRVVALEGGVRLVVEDDGPGIPPALHRTVFAPFVQGAASGVQSQPGTGIGLSLVSKLAELHGGEARLEDPPGGGTRFVVDLPGPHLDGGSAVAAYEDAQEVRGLRATAPRGGAGREWVLQPGVGTADGMGRAGERTPLAAPDWRSP